MTPLTRGSMTKLRPVISATARLDHCLDVGVDEVQSHRPVRGASRSSQERGQKRGSGENRGRGGVTGACRRRGLGLKRRPTVPGTAAARQ
jgi:hypothetical protein